MKQLVKALAALLCLGLLIRIFPAVHAAEATVMAQELTSGTAISGTGYSSFGFLKDGNIKSYVTSGGNAVLTLENDSGIGGLYLMFDLEYGEYTVVNNDTGAAGTAGGDGILHEFVDIAAMFGAPAKSVTLKFEKGSVRLSEIRSFTQGDTPEDVQRWQAPAQEADLVLFATHGDDDQLFFAGLLPKYSHMEDVVVQVVYLTDHRNLTKGRTHEMLNGLWNVGVRCYPVFGKFADFRIDSLEGTYQQYASLGTSRNDLQSYVVEQIRRFKPKVAVGHDLKGEYGHGMHMVYADLLTKALDLTGDPNAFPESAEKYGTWEVQKTYLHLYGENPVVIDYDTPMEQLGGLTPFEVTQKYGYPCHESQQWTWFTRWINGAMDQVTIHKASQIATYSPCSFGLYRSTVGADVEKNDFLENIETYAQQHAREDAQRQELEKRVEEILKELQPIGQRNLTETEQAQFSALRAELETISSGGWSQESMNRLEVLSGDVSTLSDTVQKRLEAERLEQEREEALRLEREEQERLERERKEQAERLKRDLTIAFAALVVLAAALVGVLLVMRARNIRRHKKRVAARRRKNNP